MLADVGRLLRCVHDMPAGATYSGRPSISAWIGHWLTIVLDWWGRSDSAGPATATQIAAARAWFAEVGPAIDGAGAGTTILLDGRPEHFIVDTHGAVGLIDVADLDSGDPAMDLAVLELDEPGMCDAVSAGYQPSADERARLETVLPFYVFLRALAAARGTSGSRARTTWLTCSSGRCTSSRPDVPGADATRHRSLSRDTLEQVFETVGLAR